MAHEGIDVKDFTDGTAARLKTTQKAGVSSPDVTEHITHHNIDEVGEGIYETVAASQADQLLGSTGAVGDYLAGVLVVPATTSPGAVSLKDGSTSPDISITIFTGGASSVSNLVPFFVPLGIKSLVGGWRLTTGGNVSCIAVGNFT